MNHHDKLWPLFKIGLNFTSVKNGVDFICFFFGKCFGSRLKARVQIDEDSVINGYYTLFMPYMLYDFLVVLEVFIGIVDKLFALFKILRYLHSAFLSTTARLN